MKKKLSGNNQGVLVVHHELQKIFKLTFKELVILEFMYRYRNRNKFIYQKASIHLRTGISRKTIDKAIKKFLAEGILQKEDGVLVFNHRFNDIYEDLCDGNTNEKRFSKIDFSLVSEFGLTPLQFSCLHSIAVLRKKYGWRGSMEKQVSKTLNISHRYYYKLRDILERKKFLKVSSNGTPSITIFVEESFDHLI